MLPESRGHKARLVLLVMWEHRDQQVLPEQQEQPVQEQLEQLARPVSLVRLGRRADQQVQLVQPVL